MAEIRKFDPAVGNAIAQALQQAMGDPIRPNPPGRPTGPSPDDSAEPAAQTAWVSLRVTEPQPKPGDQTG